ncbi:hypothetical protein [Halomonas sp. TD01]|uniref:hypothetical protein n=1 Tax=Halomonas sp. TD01 TaxID=999141 RepID=UPI000214E343|nr:hypothetical protein [Halomonas sp. TD01]EGP18875.1 hypothetical protein GME_14835 [Halomonas sp. TD01]CAH1042102.1 hypothetical protein HPTD01_580 [Halomonas sp. TD01]
MHDTAIVLGSTGAIGKQLVTQLTQREELAHVIVLMRRELTVSQFFPAAISSKISLRVIDFEKLEEQAAGKAVRPIATRRVAAAMIDVAFSGEPTQPTFVLSNAAMHSISCSLTSG